MGSVIFPHRLMPRARSRRSRPSVALPPRSRRGEPGLRRVLPPYLRSPGEKGLPMSELVSKAQGYEWGTNAWGTAYSYLRAPFVVKFVPSPQV